MPAQWPNSLDFAEAVQDPAHCFADPDLRAAIPAVDAFGLPRPCTGSFADVYQLLAVDGTKSWAVKCFTRSVAKLKERYREISRYLEQGRFRLTVEFKYLERGIRIRGDWYPVLKMEWVEGLTLRQFVQENLTKPKILESLYQVWFKVDQFLTSADAAHGDLQHGNMLLVPGRRQGTVSLRLIDYDGMWVPALAQDPPDEVGHAAYQHPRRAEQKLYTPDVDRFPSLVIACALKVLAQGDGPDLWRQFDNGDNLLFKRKDFESPDRSDLLHQIWNSGDGELRAFAGRLALAAVAPPVATPAWSRLLIDGVFLPMPSVEEADARRVLGLAVAAPVSDGTKRGTAVSIPSSVDYADAMQDPSRSFADPDLRAAEPVLNALGLPQAYTGNFADVYQLRSVESNQSWAVKCFTRPKPGLKERYREIGQHLEQARLSLSVKFEFLDQGIRIRDLWYPVLKMEWVEGQFLREFIHDNLDKPSQLERLYELWLEVEPELFRAGVVHGDLQHGNVMVVGDWRDPWSGPQSIRLIDYDDMWVPVMAQPPAGHPAFQHPQWARQVPTPPSTDRFPNLVIACALKCLTLSQGPGLWQRFDNGENLLFTKRDFEQPAQSELLRQIWNGGDEESRAWAGRLILAATSPVAAMPPMSEFLIVGTIPRLDRSEASQVREVMGTGTYHAEIYPANPTGIIFLVDQSQSMDQPISGDLERRKKDAVARAVNDQLRHLCIQAARQDNVRDLFQVAVIGYGGHKAQLALRGELSGRTWIPISEIASNPLRVEMQTRVTDDGQGGLLMQKKAFPVWIDPVAAGAAAPGNALHMAHELLSEFLLQYPHCFPPLVINLCGGVFDDDPAAEAAAVRQLSSSDGDVLLFNVHYSNNPGSPFQFPDWEQGLPDDTALRLFRMSSVLPPAIIESARRDGVEAQPEARAYVLDADLPAVGRFLKTGT